MIRLFRAGRQIGNCWATKYRTGRKKSDQTHCAGLASRSLLLLPGFGSLKSFVGKGFRLLGLEFPFILWATSCKIWLIFSYVFPFFLCCAIVSCHIWKQYLLLSFFVISSHWMFTSSSSGSSASFTFERLAATVVPFVRASEFARVSGSLSSKHLSFLHCSIDIRKI